MTRLSTALGSFAVLALAGSVTPARAEKPAHLELRIVATKEADREGLEAASKTVTDAKNKEALEKLAREGKPPLAPTEAVGGRHYAWAELSAAMVRETKPEQAGAKGEPKTWALGGSEVLLYGRPCVNTRLTEEERKQRQHDYFILTRLPAADQALTGKYLTSVESAGKDTEPTVRFALNEKGGTLLKELTAANKGQPLAIVVDGKVQAAPTIRSAVQGNGQITGKFSKQEIEELVKALRSDIPGKE